MAFQFSLATPPPPYNFIDVLGTLGLKTNLKLCLDAGDGVSVASGSQTKWFDVAGGGYDFFRGTDATSQSSDPTFNGTPGGGTSSEYWSFDGGDSLTYDTTNETWMQALHKDSAAWTFAAWIYAPPDTGTIWILNTSELTTGVNIAYDINIFTISVTNATATAFSTTVANDYDNSTWKFISFTIDEANNAFRANISGTAYSGSCTYSSPSSGNATKTMEISAPSRPLAGGSRLNSVMMWQGTALSAANMEAIFQNTRAKFGV